MDENKKLASENKQVEAIIGRIMQIGVVLSAIVILAGLLLMFAQGNDGYPAGVHPHTFSAIYAGIVAAKPDAVMMLGLFLLILTPVLRVVVSIYAFAKEHDHFYTIITTVVLIILIVAMWIGYYGI